MLDVYDTTFERNCGYMGNGWGKLDGPGALALYNGGVNGHVSVVSNCVFKGNFTKNVFSYAGAVQLMHGKTNTVAMLDCRFTGNRWNLSENTRGSASICSGSQDTSCGPFFVHNSYFAENIMSNAFAGAGSYSLSSVWTDAYNSTKATFLNCTFERNVAAAPNETKGRYGTLSANSPSLAVVNCTFADNDSFGAGGKRVSDINLQNIWNSQDFSLVNSILWHSAENYVSLPATNVFSNRKGAILASNAIKNNSWLDCADEGELTGLGFMMNAFSDDAPGLCSTSKTYGTVTARGITADSVWRKAGVPIYLSDDLRIFVYYTGTPASSSTPWTCLTQHQSHLTDAAAAGLGVSLDNSQPADAFGQPRIPGRIAIGPLNASSAALIISIR